jgi:hypothetical protein
MSLTFIYASSLSFSCPYAKNMGGIFLADQLGAIATLASEYIMVAHRNMYPLVGDGLAIVRQLGVKAADRAT